MVLWRKGIWLVQRHRVSYLAADALAGFEHGRLLRGGEGGREMGSKRHNVTPRKEPQASFAVP